MGTPYPSVPITGPVLYSICFEKTKFLVQLVKSLFLFIHLNIFIFLILTLRFSTGTRFERSSTEKVLGGGRQMKLFWPEGNQSNQRAFYLHETNHGTKNKDASLVKLQSFSNPF